MGFVLKMLGVSIVAGGLYGSALYGQHIAMQSLHALTNYTYNPEHLAGNDPASNALRSDLTEIQTSLSR